MQKRRLSPHIQTRQPIPDRFADPFDRSRKTDGRRSGRLYFGIGRLFPSGNHRQVPTAFAAPYAVYRKKNRENGLSLCLRHEQFARAIRYLVK
jgi:hypothetical protein